MSIEKRIADLESKTRPQTVVEQEYLSFNTIDLATRKGALRALLGCGAIGMVDADGNSLTALTDEELENLAKKIVLTTGPQPSPTKKRP